MHYTGLAERVAASHPRPFTASELDAYMASVGPSSTDDMHSYNPASQPDSPANQPLKRRLLDYHQRAADSLAALGYRHMMAPGPAMDRFRDIAPSLVLAVFDGDLAQVEPGGVGPLPLGHPVIVELVECVNAGFVTPTIMALALADTRYLDGYSNDDDVADGDGDDNDDASDNDEYNHGTGKNNKLYDGGLVVGLLDYRRSCSFATVTAPQPHPTPPPSNPTTATNGLLSSMAAMGVAPEMHKVYLRSGYGAIAPFIPAQCESEVLLKLHPRIITDPDPKAWQALEWAMYERDKVAVHCADLLTDYPITTNTTQTLTKSRTPTLTTLPHTQQHQQQQHVPLIKLKTLSAVDEFRSRQAAGAAEAFLGIDQRRNLARTRSHIPTTVMNNPNQRVWRTLRFEREHHRLKLYYSVNILCKPATSHTNNNNNNNNSNTATSGFEVVLRRGEVPDTAQGRHGFTQRFTLPTLAAVEHYIGHLKQLFAVEDGLRRLTVDVANPAVLSASGSASSNGNQVRPSFR